MMPLSSDPDVLRGQTVIAGTRVPLDSVRDYRRSGRPIDDFLLDFPSVEPWQAQILWGVDDAEMTRLIDVGRAERR